MPHSYPEYKNEIKQHFISSIPLNTKILDVGPGAGTYSDLLRGLGYSIDCLEIWEPYINQFNLNSKYDKVILGDVRDFQLFSDYDYIIMGDVLEHLYVEEAKIIIDDLESKNIKHLVAVPYNFPAGEYEGNVYETHLQPDLTPENVLIRYPNLKLLYGNHFYGYYVSYKNESILTTIANKNMVDKGTVHYEAHGYTEIYSEYIPNNKKGNLLEIGVWHGDSIRMWNEYNPEMEISAIDIDENVKYYMRGDEKLNLYIGNQSDENFLKHILFWTPGGFDFIIDDGSHNHDDVLNSFKYLVPSLKNGAIYFIEDLHAGGMQRDRLISNIMMEISKNKLSLTDVKFFCDGKLLMFKF